MALILSTPGGKMQVALVACGASKTISETKAKDLYTSYRFQLTRQIASTCDRWFILSAKHYLLDPEIVISPYNLTLSNMGIKLRRTWARKVMQSIDRAGLNMLDTNWLILAGAKYREFLVPRLLGNVAIPLVGLGMGSQLAALKLLARTDVAGCFWNENWVEKRLTFLPKYYIIKSSNQMPIGLLQIDRPSDPNRRLVMNKSLQSAINKVETELMPVKAAAEEVGCSAFSLRQKARAEEPTFESVELFGRILIPTAEVTRLKKVEEERQAERETRVAEKATKKRVGPTNAELRAKCDELGLKKGGTKTELVARLEAYQKGELVGDEKASPKAKKASPKPKAKKASPEAVAESVEDDVPSLDDLLEM